MGAHYDAVPGSPGADDNGSALAVLLELARAFSTVPARRPIRLIALDLEESDRAGSRVYAKDLVEPVNPWHHDLLEMLGYRDPRPGSQRYPTGLRYFYPGTGDFIGLIGNLRALPHLWRLAGEVRKAVPCEFLPFPLKGVSFPTRAAAIMPRSGISAILHHSRTRPTCETRTTIAQATGSKRWIWIS